MNLNIEEMVETMWGAAKVPLGNAATAAEPFAKSQFTNIAQTVAQIAAGIATGQIDEQQATLLLSMEKHATETALLTVEGLGIVAAESAINAALGSVTTLVNTAVGFALI